MQYLVTIYIDINPSAWLAWLHMIYYTTLTLLILPNDSALCDYSYKYNNCNANIIDTDVVLQLGIGDMWIITLFMLFVLYYYVCR